MANGTTYTAAQMEAKMSPEDQAALKAAKEGWGAAYAAGDEAGKASYAKAAEDVRAKYYYSGGEDGSKVIFFNDGKMPDGLVLNGGGSGTGKAGSNGRSQDTVDELKGLYGDSGAYARALAQQQGANELAVKQTVSELQAQKTQTNQSYADTFRQLYIQKKNAQKNLGQRLAAQGVNGGASESSMLDLETSYSEALRQGEQARINAQGELDRAISQAKLTGDIENARIAADGVREQTAGYAGVLQNLLNRQDSWDMHDETTAKNDAYTRAQLLGQAGDFSGYKDALDLTDEQVGILEEHDARGDKLTAAQMLAEAGDYSGYQELLGLTPEQVAALEANHNSNKVLTAADLMAQAGDFSLYKTALGLTDEQAATLAAWYKKQNTPAVRYSGGGGGYKPTLTAAQTLAALKDGVVNDATLKAYEYYYGQEWEGDDGEPVVEDAQPIAKKKVWPNGTTTYQWNGKGYNVLDFMLRDFTASNPSAGDVRQMNEFLKSIGSEYELAYE